MENQQYADVKARTLELYDQLPQEEEARKSRLDIRDEILKLNYSFFGYIASRTYINNTSVEYADKLQSALCNFCKCWWWYKWEGHYRTDISFSSFYTLRIAEMIERELNDVKYSLRRSLCMKAGAQLGKHWGQVKYEDLSKIQLDPEDMTSLKAIFGAVYWADLSEHELYMPAPDSCRADVSRYLTNEYDDIEGLLIHEMVENESRLSDVDLYQLSELTGISFNELKAAMPRALKRLHDQLTQNLDLQEN